MTQRHARDRAASPFAALRNLLQASVPSPRTLRSGRHQGDTQALLASALPGWAFDASPTATIVTDDRLHIVAANPAYERLTGLDRSQWMGARPCVEGPLPDAGGPQACGREGKPSEPREVILRCQDGSRRRAWMSWACMSSACGAARLHVATFSEPGRWYGEFELWRHRARHDALTGLPNRDHLEAELERGLARAARHGHRLAVLFIDLDGFKPINDDHGHAAGDRLLARVGQRLRDALRAEDFVARYGGDEFVVVIEAPRQVTDAASAAEAVLAALARERAVPGDAGSSIRASIGIALYPDHACDGVRLLQLADDAMYRAKRSGGHAFAVAQVGGDSQPRPREAA